MSPSSSRSATRRFRRRTLLRRCSARTTRPTGSRSSSPTAGRRRHRRRRPASSRPSIPNLQLVDNPRRLSSAGRNLGVRHARGEYVPSSWTATASSATADYLRRPGRRVRATRRRQPRPAAAARRDRTRRRSSGRSPPPGRRGSGTTPDSFIYSDDGAVRAAAERGRRLPPGRVRPGRACSTSRSTPARTWSSTPACTPPAARCYFAPRLAVALPPAGEPAAAGSPDDRYGRGRARLLLKHPATFSVPPLVPAAFLVCARWRRPFRLWVPGFATVFCAILDGLRFWPVLGGRAPSRGRAPGLAALLPAVFASIHVGAGWGVLAEWISRPVPHAPVRRGPSAHRAPCRRGGPSNWSGYAAAEAVARAATCAAPAATAARRREGSG